MDSNLDDMIRDLTAKIRKGELNYKSVNIENALMEFKTELHMKRVRLTHN